MTEMILAMFAAVAVGSAPTAVPFAPGEVKVGGEIGRRMELTVEKMLHQTDVEGTFVRHFRHRKKTPDEPGGFAGYGMFLDALVKAAAHGIGGEETVREKSRLLAELADVQTADGRISMFDGPPGFWDNHEGAYLIQALCRDHRWFGSEMSLRTAVRLGDSLMDQGAKVTLGSETAFLLLYEESRDPRYLRWLETEARMDADIDAYDRFVTVNGIQHVYTYLARALGQLQYAELTQANGERRERLAAAAQGAFRRAQGPYLSITGSITGTPRWGELWDASQCGLGKWGETCASAYLMRLAAFAELHGLDLDLADLYERVMYNAFFSAQSDDGLKYRYWTPFNERASWFDRDTYCCPNNYKREVFEIPDSVFLRTATGVAVNLYSDAVLKSEAASIAMTTAYPLEGRVEIVARMQGNTLKLRIPSWCGAATVRVDDEEPQKTSCGWADVVRDFSKPVRVVVEFPMDIRLVPGVRAQEGRVAVMRGPCVYALQTGTPSKADQDVDLWDLDPSRPLVWNAETGTVDALFHNRNRDRKAQVMSLVRYASDNRDRTYFDLVRKDEPASTVSQKENDNE